MTSATTGSSYLVHTISQKIRWQIISYLERFVTVYSKVRYFQWYFTGQGPGSGLGCWWLLGDLSIFHLGQGGSHFSGIVGAYHLSQLLPRSQTPHYTIQISRYYFYVSRFYFCSFAAAFEYSVLRCCLSPGQCWHIAVNKEALLFSSTQLSALINP